MEKEISEQNIFNEDNHLFYLDVGESYVIENSVVTTEVSSIPDSDDGPDEKLKTFLKFIDLEVVFDYLRAAQVTFRSLPYLKEKDLKEVIPPLGLRVEFREKLFAWKKSELGIDDDTLSMPSKVEQWLNQNYDSTMSPSCSNSGKSNSKDIKLLLSKSSRGKTILECSNKGKPLSCEQREEIINIIIEDVIENKTVLHTHDFVRFTDDICLLFPSENNMRDYYYIPRRSTNNASGKLFSKYKNKFLKRRKLETPNESFSPTTIQVSDSEVVEYFHCFKNFVEP